MHKRDNVTLPFGVALQMLKGAFLSKALKEGHSLVEAKKFVESEEFAKMLEKAVLSM